MKSLDCTAFYYVLGKYKSERIFGVSRNDS